ncbi:MAG: M48 family metallopeptidase [Methylobacterium sp.]|uniref:M48 family metallopeptidase n=1 Tax=Methylobacterium sp. TaxID=409 RepID=UPI0025E1FC14|nr:M48 family metallopeptidase [Methylobacterium sp.]MBX9931329.1 M48 family metallopeptidase [Methylobacterium sp.]
MTAYGLYTHIRANEIRSRVLVGILFALVLVLAFGAALVVRAMGGNLPAGSPPALSIYLAAAAGDLIWLGPIAFAGAFLWLFVAYHAHQRLIDGVTGARAVTRAEAPELYGLLENLCIARGLTVPRLNVVEDQALNAYATGLNPNQYAITVTTGLTQALNPREMEAVLAHELTHIRNDDVRTMMIAILIAGVFSFAGEMLMRGNLTSGRGRDRGGALPALLIGVALVVIAWGASRLIRFSLSRTREYVADAGAVELTKDPDAMIGALLKISGRGELARAPSGVMEMCVDNPRSGIGDLFATHPSIDDRIAALTRYAGGSPPERR